MTAVEETAAPVSVGVCAGGCSRRLYPASTPLVDVPEGGVRDAGRSLCKNCWRVAKDAGRLEDHRRRTMPRDVLLEEVAVLRSDGVPAGLMAGRLGMTRSAFDRAMLRARAAVSGE